MRTKSRSRWVEAIRGLPSWRGLIADRRIQAGLGVIAAGVLAWTATQPSRQELAAEGEILFVHEWTSGDPLSGEGDGLGPVFNATSCAACHPRGGASGNDHNVTAYETLPSRNDPEPGGGVVHAQAIAGVAKETLDRVHELFPVVPGGRRTVANCTIDFSDFDPVIVHSINTPALFGVGLIDDISGWEIRCAALARRGANAAAELSGDFDGTPTGRVRILPDGRVGKFGWKAQFATLEEFVATACAVELGLSNRVRSQDVPHEHRPDENASPDMTPRQLAGLIAYCETLESPGRVLPADPPAAAQAARGEELFTSVGCADCHTPNLGGVEGVYSDFCLHTIAAPEAEQGYGSAPEVPLPEHAPAADEWKTPPLWGVADTAPYLHDGSAPTLADAIAAHHGEARHVMERYKGLTDGERRAVMAFLNTLRAPATHPSPPAGAAATLAVN